VAALPAVRGCDLVENLIHQAEAFSPTYLLGEHAIGADPVTALADGGPTRWAARVRHMTPSRAAVAVSTARRPRSVPQDSQR
jgi:thioredoxin reductase (NADPH)